MRWKEWLGAMAICVVVAGCGSESAPDEATDPETVATDFVEAVADGDAGACDLMTSGGAEFAATVGQEDSCEAAIEAQGTYLNAATYNAGPAELTEELDSGVLEEKGKGTSYRFCLPNEGEVTIDLVEVDGEWHVAGLSVGRVEIVSGDGDRRHPPCKID
jgi:hypothetical protein